MVFSANALWESIRRQAITVLALLVLLPSVPVNAQYATGGAFATRGYGGRTPLNITYNLNMPPSMSLGILDVDITDPTGPSKVDRNLTVVLYTRNYGVAADNLAYRYNVKLAEGVPKTEIQIPFPATEGQFSWDVAVFENGRDIEDKRKSKSNPNQQDFHWSYNFNQTVNQMAVAGLVATTAEAKSEALNLKAISDIANATAAKNAGAGAVVNTNTLVSVDEAASDWRHYFPHPIWIASVDAVAEINDKHPRVAAALRTYVSAGGQLLIYDVKSIPEMASVNRLLSDAGGNAELASWKTISSPAPAWWIIEPEQKMGGLGSPATTPDPANTDSQSIQGAGAVFDAALLADTLLETGLGSHRDNVSDLLAVLGFGDVTRQQLESGRSKLMSALGTDKLLEREYARGKVIICNRRLDELSEKQIGFIVNNKIPETLSSLTLRGNDGSWFWQNIILEVGKPPVWAFCVIVALFGALLGPGLLAFTGRIERRSLMIFLVPVVSFVATLAIVLYGVMHEGFDSHVRIHSVTAYDGPARVAFGWSRQNYFSGLPPREGLQFSGEAYVRTVSAEDDVNYGGYPDPKRNIDGTVTVGEKQTWNNWLKPRQHQQLLVGHKVDPRTIPISTARNETGKLVIKNLTAGTLPMVVMRGAKDDYYFEANLGPNESREPEVQDLDSVAIEVSKIGADFKPTIPPELDGGSDSLLNFGNPRRYGRNYYAQVNEIINISFKRFLSDDLVLEPHGFATLVPEFNAIEIPLDGMQSDNVNLVIGVEPW